MHNTMTPESVAASLVKKLAAAYDEPTSAEETPPRKLASVEDVKQRIIELLSRGASAAGDGVSRGVSAAGDALSQAGGGISDSVSGIGDGLQSAAARLSPQSRAALRNALIGSGIGAGVGLLGGGTTYDAARGAAAMGIAGGAGTYAANKILGMATGPKFVPPSVQKSLDEMRDAGQPTEPQGENMNTLQWMLNNPTQTAVGGVGALAGGAAVADARDPSRSLAAKYRSPFYHLGVRDHLKPVSNVSNKPLPLRDRLTKDVFRVDNVGQDARKKLREAVSDRVSRMTGTDPVGLRTNVLTKTRSRLAAARAAADKSGSKAVVDGIDALLGLDDDSFLQAMRAADKHQGFAHAAQYSKGSRAAGLRGASLGADKTFRHLGGTGFGARQFASMTTKRPVSLNTKSLITAGLAGAGAYAADKFAVPAVSNTVFGPKITPEDVRRMGNP